MAVSFKSAVLPLVLALGFSGVASASALTENFDHGVPADWTVKNLSTPVGTTDWFAGNQDVFAAQGGAPTAYLAANFNAGADVANLSAWLILPTSSYNNGDTLSFYTRTALLDSLPDNLEVRFSQVGGVDVGASDSSVGTFSTLLLSINPDQQVAGYPAAWTQYSVTLSGLSGATTGAFAFRYAVSNSGPLGIAGDYIGIDTVQISPVPEAETYLLLGAGLGLIGWMRKRQQRPA
jgi:hypothetical protein